MGGMEWNGMEWNEWNGMEWKVWNGMDPCTEIETANGDQVDKIAANPETINLPLAQVGPAGQNECPQRGKPL